MDKDLRTKRAQFINTCVNLNEEFECLEGETQIKLLRIYNSHFTGSCQWDFKSQSFEMIANSWNVNLRIIFDLPLQTHSWIVERLSNDKHAKQMIYKRYIKFIESLHKNKRPSLQYLVKLVQRDQRSVTASNLQNIFSDTGVFVIPGNTKPFALNDCQVYKTLIGENGKLGCSLHY